MTFHFPRLEKFVTPEILRTSLEEVVLNIAGLKLGKASAFLAEAVNPPKDSSVKAAIGLLLKVLIQFSLVVSVVTLTP